MAVSPACTRCSALVEYELHYLRECTHAREIWLRMGALSWQNFRTDNMVHWIKTQACGSHNILFIAGIWGIWKWRNNAVFEETGWTLVGAWRRLAHEHDDFVTIMNPDQLANGGNLICEVWTAPQPGKTKLYTDRRWRRGGNHIGGGGLLRGSDGCWLYGFWSSGTWNNAFMAELEALKNGLRMAWDQGFRDIMAEVDNKEVLQAIQNEGSHAFFLLLEEVASLLHNQWQVELHWVPRECNSAADCLARLGLNFDM